jgi:hypothetical protein
MRLILSFLKNALSSVHGADRFIVALFCFVLAGQTVAFGANSPAVTAAPPDINIAFATYDWNLNNSERPLLSLPNHVTTDIDLSLTFPMEQFGFPLFQALYYNDRASKYILLLIPRTTRRAQFIELQKSGPAGSYTSSDGSGIQLLDTNSAKTIRTADATQYTFVRFADGALRCARIRDRNSSIYLSYTKDGLIHGIIDSSGRTIKFDYANNQLGSVTQTWTVNSIVESKTWPVGDTATIVPVSYLAPTETVRPAQLSRSATTDSVQFNHLRSPAARVPPVANGKSELAALTKSLPSNAATRVYTEEMAASDWLLASIFGGPNAVAAANGYEPPALAHQYPLYRGDLVGDDGRTFRGHLSYAMHLYGNENGTGTTGLYIPLGFTSHSTEPGPTDAAVTFYYPRLGNLTDVTLAVFHVANFGLVYETGRVRIGEIGGPGGSTPLYRHSHIEFYHGNTGLPSSAARAALRIDPVAVFDVTTEAASRLRRIGNSH